MTVSPRRALVVFARVPAMGGVKARLAASIGEAAALVAYRELAERTLATTAALPDCTRTIAFAPDDGAATMRGWLGDTVRLEAQGAGDPGTRLNAAVARRLAEGAKRIAIIGTDCADLGAADIERAWAALDTADVVLGPGEDGDFWLVALEEPQPALFHDVPWGTGETLTETLRRAQELRLKVVLLGRKRDVETVTDWRAWKARGDVVALATAPDPERGDAPAALDPELPELDVPPPPVHHPRWWRLGVLLLIILGAILVGRLLGIGQYTHAATLQETVEDLRHLRWIMPGFVAAFTLGATIGLPATPFYLMGGALFGPVLGTLLNWGGATLGAMGSFLLSRTLGHGALAHMVRRRVPDLHNVVATHGFATVMRLRLIPVFPYNALNFGAGLAGMGFVPYVIATALGIVPAVILYTYLGHSIAEGALGGGAHSYLRALAVGAVIVVFSFLPTVVKRMRSRKAGTRD